MTKTMKVKSMLLSMLALLAISMTTMTLSSCGDDDDDDAVSLYKQWETDAANVDMPTETFSKVVYDFTERGKIKMLVKLAKDLGGGKTYKAGNWYTAEEADVTVTPTSDTEGFLTIRTNEEYTPIKSKVKMKEQYTPTIKYKLTKNTLILEFGETPVTFKATSGIKSSGDISSVF